MDNKLQIYCENNGMTKEFDFGCTLMDIYEGMELNMENRPLCALVNNKIEGLRFRVFSNKHIRFLDITSAAARRVYVRSLCFVLWKAVDELYPGVSMLMEAPVSNGYYFTLNLGRELELEDAIKLKERMKEIIDKDMKFHRVECPTADAVKLFRDKGMESKARLYESLGTLYSFYYRLEDTIDYYYGSLVPSTGYLKLFDLVKYYDGLLLRVPDIKETHKLGDVIKQEKMLGVFREDHRLEKLLGVSTVGDLNFCCKRGMASDLIMVSEALQEKKIIHIADDICTRENVGVVLISGPSSSGKTTFSKRLSIQLMTSGRKPYPVSLDDYFLDREATPKDENGDYDFESIYALDLDYFNKQLNQLLSGEEIELPRYNFQTGKREASGQRLKLEKNMILVLEGIHALNPMLTEKIPEDRKYKIYVSALTTIKLDDHNYIPNTDNRMIRRIVRDYKYRGCSAEETIRRWPSVRRGEDKWIFPYQERADAMFNSALLFELAVLRNQVMPLLDNVQEDKPEYAEAFRLKMFLRLFYPVSSRELPPTSLLREFLGGSSFRY